ncbi:MAG: histidinol-phosphate transaminase [Anaerolineales bacterium]|nr:histidinol-phosphate transaminase [Anaerolineales bacterium]
MIVDFIRPHIVGMPPYQPILPFEVLSAELGIPVEKLVKLDANENPYGPLPEVREGLAALNDLHIYPDPESRRIRELLAEYHGISEESIVIGAGADELIDLIMRLVLAPGERLINCPHTFGMYAFDGALNQAEVINVPRQADFSLDIAGIEKAVMKYKPKLLFLANPNNPDGGLIPTDQIKALLKLPLLFVLDEAYVNFSSEESRWINEVQSYPNLVVLRTFSKWAGLAGLRIGYGVFPLAFVPMLMKAKQPYNVSVAAREAACISIQNVEKLNRNTALILDERERLFSALASIPWLEPYPSQANFILCRVVGRQAAEVKEQLRAQGILIRHFNKPGLSDHIRISVGRPEDTTKIMTALENME